MNFEAWRDQMDEAIGDLMKAMTLFLKQKAELVEKLI